MIPKRVILNREDAETVGCELALAAGRTARLAKTFVFLSPTDDACDFPGTARQYARDATHLTHLAERLLLPCYNWADPKVAARYARHRVASLAHVTFSAGGAAPRSFPGGLL